MKTTGLYGNEVEKVSDTGWVADSSVTVYGCATMTYSSSTCDQANKLSATVTTGAANWVSSTPP